jgi:hypothetical protein
LQKDPLRKFLADDSTILMAQELWEKTEEETARPDTPTFGLAPGAADVKRTEEAEPAPTVSLTAAKHPSLQSFLDAVSAPGDTSSANATFRILVDKATGQGLNSLPSVLFACA